MRKIFLILSLFIFSCDEELDCAGIPGGSATEDDCGVCSGGTTGLIANESKDCAGVCDGDAIVDCEGECEGGTQLDECGICGGPGVPEGYLEHNNSCYYGNDIIVLEDFINNSIETIDMSLDLNSNNNIDWYELGSQEWESYNDYKRLVKFSHRLLDDEVVLSTTGLSGNIPESIGNWTFVRYLDLGYPLDEGKGQLSGNIPQSIENLINLEFLYIDNTNISGNIPDIFSNLSKLEILWLNDNNFSGTIPESIWALTSLRILLLARNNLSGNISSEVSNLTNLEQFWVGTNNFSGLLPDELWQLDKITGLWLENNNFTGTLSSDIGNLSSLSDLYLSGNLFNSIIPDEICDLNLSYSNLDSSYTWYDEEWKVFNIDNNQFCPPYPDCIGDYVGTQDCEPSIYSPVGTWKLTSVENHLGGVSDGIDEATCNSYEPPNGYTGWENNGCILFRTADEYGPAADWVWTFNADQTLIPEIDESGTVTWSTDNNTLILDDGGAGIVIYTSMNYLIINNNILELSYYPNAGTVMEVLIFTRQ